MVWLGPCQRALLERVLEILAGSEQILTKKVSNLRTTQPQLREWSPRNLTNKLRKRNGPFRAMCVPGGTVRQRSRPCRSSTIRPQICGLSDASSSSSSAPPWRPEIRLKKRRTNSDISCLRADMMACFRQILEESLIKTTNFSRLCVKWMISLIMISLLLVTQTLESIFSSSNNKPNTPTPKSKTSKPYCKTPESIAAWKKFSKTSWRLTHILGGPPKSVCSMRFLEVSWFRIESCIRRLAHPEKSNSRSTRMTHLTTKRVKALNLPKSTMWNKFCKSHIGIR